MEGLDAEMQKKYDKCKMVVKVWEHKFKKKYGRVPSKHDIKEADHDIRYAYKTYFNIKSAMIEKTFMDIDGFNSDEDESRKENMFNNKENMQSNQETNIEENDAEEPAAKSSNENLNDTHSADLNSTQSISDNSMDNMEYIGSPLVIEETQLLSKVDDETETICNKTWGDHLNNKKKDKPKQEKSTVNSSFTKKLFIGSKFSKRNPRKSLSFTHRKSELFSDKSISFSQPETSSSSFIEPSITALSQEEAVASDTLSIFQKSKVKITSLPQEVHTKSLSVIDKLLDDKQSISMHSIDGGWLKRTAAKTGLKLTNKDVKMTQKISFDYASTDTTGFAVPSENVQVDNTKVDYDSEDIIEDSEEEDNICNHVAKKRKIYSLSQKQDSSNILNKFNVNNTHTAAPSSSTNTQDYMLAQTRVNNSKVGKDMTTESISVSDNASNSNPINESAGINSSLAGKIMNNIVQYKEEPVKVKTVAKQSKKITKQKKSAKVIDAEDSLKDLPPRKSGRQRKTFVTLEPESESDRDPFKSDNDSDDPEFNIGKAKKEFESPERNKSPTRKAKEPKESKTPKAPKEKPATKGKRASKKEEKAEQEEEDNATYELEFSVKPRIQTVPRVDLKRFITEKKTSLKAKQPKEDKTEDMQENVNGIKDKRQQAKEKLEKKIAAGSLNDNFLQIDIRKKMYTRGKKQMNFSKYKKKLWKSKKKALAIPDMDMGGCDGGSLTCFLCGKTGHFARQCKETKGDGLLPLGAEDEEPCPYPTLEEANAMAKFSKFAVRMPKLKNPEENDENIQENTKQDASDDHESDTEGNDDEIVIENEEFKFDDDDDDALLAETMKIEDHVRQLDVKHYLDTTTFVSAYYNLKEDGTLIDTPIEVLDMLKIFGHTSFREGQERAIMRILSGQSTLVTLSTGSGKSLCYQLPAYLYAKREPCISLIISPLVSLMEDQVTGIPHILKAACLHTNQTKPQREKIMAALGAGEINILLISPEAVVAGEKSNGFGSLLRKLPPIAFACIDEAHCVSQWSHNFRPSYLMICRILRERLGVTTILGLTATATRATSDSIINHLHIPDGRNGIISNKPIPGNLRLTVSKDKNRDNALLELLNSDEFSKFKSIIIYCIRRDECERIASYLRTSLKYEKKVETTSKKRKRVDVQAEPYHAGLSASRRRTIQKNFMGNELRIVVATVAFGMGINKSDLRAVIHYNAPKNFESYVQEVGRAGRDGLPAHCHLFLDNQDRDEAELRRHIFSNSIDRHVIRKLLQRIFVKCSCKNVCPRHEVAFSIAETVQHLDIPEENIATLLCYLELHENRYIEVLSPAYTTCRIISYGGPLQIRKAAKDCPPLAMALVMHKEQDDNVLEFPVIDIASAIGWDSGICKHILKNLEWTKVNNAPKRSTLTVNYQNLGFRLMAPGNLTDLQLDEALDSIYDKVKNQEKTALLQLHALHSTLGEVSTLTYKSCLVEAVTEKEHFLKEKIREYFESPKPLEILPEIKTKPINEDQVIANIRSLIIMYRDNVFTGRAIARIFHGIQSPNYPAVIWGRCKFWRAHIMEDFNTLCTIATKEILKMRT